MEKNNSILIDGTNSSLQRAETTETKQREMEWTIFIQFKVKLL
jgi:hypothetical protein